MAPAGLRRLAARDAFAPPRARVSDGDDEATRRRLARRSPAPPARLGDWMRSSVRDRPGDDLPAVAFPHPHAHELQRAGQLRAFEPAGASDAGGGALADVTSVLDVAALESRTAAGPRVDGDFG